MNLQDHPAAAAFLLGLGTALQPCPMTANLATVAWLGRRAGSMSGSVFSALFFILGQSATYVALAWLVLAGVASTSRLSLFLQQHANEVLGPVWIVTAMALLGLIEFRLPRIGLGRAYSPLPLGEGQGVRAAGSTCAFSLLPKGEGTIRPHPNPRLLGEGTVRVWTAFPLGVLLALAFCPVTAVLFFVDLLAIATSGGSRVVYPLLYALGAALPVAMLALLLGAGSRWLGAALNRTQRVQWWLNRVAGGILLLVGVYSCLRFNFGFSPF